VNINIFLLIMFAVSLAARAEPDPSPSPSPTPSPVAGQPTTQAASKFDPGLLGGNNPVLTDQEKAGVAITQAWRDKSYETMVGPALIAQSSSGSVNLCPRLSVRSCKSPTSSSNQAKS
jgi:hypothetical protein